MNNLPNTLGMDEFLDDLAAQQREDAAFQTPEALHCLDEIALYARALDAAMRRMDALVPPPAGCVSGLTADNQHGWFTEPVPVLRGVARVRG